MSNKKKRYEKRLAARRKAREASPRPKQPPVIRLVDGRVVTEKSDG